MKEPVYEVFARKTKEEPLRHIGFINALTGDLARVCAWKTYDEQNWFEMCVVPRASILSVNLKEGPYSMTANGSARDLVRGSGAGSYGGEEVVG